MDALMWICYRTRTMPLDAHGVFLDFILHQVEYSMLPKGII